MLNSRLKDGLVLVEHVACAECRYDLFGLPLDGACPECGHDVTASREFQRLREAKRARKRGRPSPLRGIIVVLLVTAAGGVGAGVLFRSSLIASQAALIVGVISFKTWRAARTISRLAWTREEIALDDLQLARLAAARRALLARQSVAEKPKPVAAENARDGGVVKPGR